MNKIYNGDCLFVMRHDILERGIQVDLIYLDPPFFTGKVQKGTWQPGAMEVSYEDSKSFWGTKGASGAPTWIKEVGVNRPAFASYLEYMRKRLELCKRILKDTGSIYLHCDHRASHYLKMVMDDIFGVQNFRNEIIWCYVGGGYPKTSWGRKHDVILYYTKSKKWTFNLDDVKFEYQGDIKIHADGSKYKHDKKHPEDWWHDISPTGNLGPSFKERVGYPTQKPLALLERIIKASSNKNDLILDPFCGCGTAIVAAERLSRKWIGIDSNPDACMVMQKRFEDQFNLTPLVQMRTLEEVKKLKPMQFEAWVNEYYNAKKPKPDRGIDGITPQGWPIQTKTFKVKYNTVAQFRDDIDNHPKVPRPANFGIIVSQKGFDESAIARAYQIKERHKINIKLMTLEEMLPDGQSSPTLKDKNEI